MNSVDFSANLLPILFLGSLFITEGEAKNSICLLGKTIEIWRVKRRQRILI